MDLQGGPNGYLEGTFIITLMYDKKNICRISCTTPNFELPERLTIKSIVPASFFSISNFPRWPSVNFRRYPVDDLQKREWGLFLNYLLERDKVAIIQHNNIEFLIPPPTGQNPMQMSSIRVPYRTRKLPVPADPEIGNITINGIIKESVLLQPVHQALPQKQFCVKPDVITSGKKTYDRNDVDAFTEIRQSPLVEVEKVNVKSVSGAEFCKASTDNSKFEESNANMKIHPDCLVSLGQNHAGWIFGAVAELVDNSRDANASSLDICIQTEYYKILGRQIPVLVVKDNGSGMTHTDIQRMLSLGHELPKHEDNDIIGRYGVGFKAGSMRLGRDVLVLTQSKKTRSIGFLSYSFNENKKSMEVPIITYQKEGNWMEFDLSVHSHAQAESYLSAVKEYSPFNEYSIGNMFASFGEDGTGTQIYIYNLVKWGSDYLLEWDEMDSKNTEDKKKRDIMVRSRRVRSRNGQTSKEVPLDYSLHAYLEVIFLEPRMKIFVQGSMVKTRRLAKSLNKTKVITDMLLEKPVQLTLGRSLKEAERGNCGIFLYWHGRLIEAYKRVGGMIHSADMGRGIIGVIDVTEIMTGEGSDCLVLNNKQGFDDTEVYAKLEQWLGIKADDYWDENFDTLDMRNNNSSFQPDNDWVQCNKCWKWRILDPEHKSTLSDEWFCYMEPFNGSCNVPQQETEAGIVTVGTKRSIGGFTSTKQVPSVKKEGKSETMTDGDDENLPLSRTFKRLKKGPVTRSSKRVSSKTGI